MKIIKDITEADAIQDSLNLKHPPLPIRRTVRAVVFDDDAKIALIKVGKQKYYTLPGGGIDPNEESSKAIRRECIEEIGCDIKLLSKIGTINEVQPSLNRIQSSDCYLAYKKFDHIKQQLTQEEIEKEYSFEWVSVNDAIELLQNCQPTDYKGKFVKIRDVLFLQIASKLYQKNAPPRSS